VATVVLDTSVLIHLDEVRQLGLLACLQGVEFVFPDEVWQELVRTDRRARALAAIRAGGMRRLRLDVGTELPRMIQFLDQGLDQGESACLALAESRDFLVATDDRKALRDWEACVGANRSLSTPGLILLAMRRGLLDLATADACLAVWATHRFKLSFTSFAALV
jgi:predicted nucleic acid-binding protein